MEKSDAPANRDMLGASPEAEQLIKQFVEHWGLMARAWGINSTMGELFALLYITGSDWMARAPQAISVRGRACNAAPADSDPRRGR